MFFHRNNPAYLQVLIFIKYFALLMLFTQNIKKPVVLDTDKAYASYSPDTKEELVVEGFCEPVTPGQEQ
jgi:hypothetical protein